MNWFRLGLLSSFKIIRCLVEGEVIFCIGYCLVKGGEVLYDGGMDYLFNLVVYFIIFGAD